MDQLLKNQKYLFISIFGGLITVYLLWYFFLYKGLSKEYKQSSRLKSVLSSEVNKYKDMETQIASMQTEWDILNNEFEMVIEKIPDKRLFENVTDHLYSLIINHGLKIQKFTPSEAAIDKQTILIPETGDEVIVEKVPIDITLRGSFIDFGQLLESMKTGRYRLTVSNIDIAQKRASPSQTIKFISYGYFQSMSSGNRLAQNKTPIIKKNKPINKTTKKENAPKTIDVASVVDKKVKQVPDSLEGVPEMWLEPATEPIDETTTVAEKPSIRPKPEISKPKKVKKKNPEEPIVTIEKNNTPVAVNKTNNLYNSIEVLESKVCKKVKNNQPLYPGKRFPIDIGKVYCHSLLNNNSGKHNDIYHIWYMNGNLKAKVRIRVREGQEIPAVSHREVGKSTDKGTWKIEITDSDKKFLDTVIFEVV